VRVVAARRAVAHDSLPAPAALSRPARPGRVAVAASRMVRARRPALAAAAAHIAAARARLAAADSHAAAATAEAEPVAVATAEVETVAAGRVAAPAVVSGWPAPRNCC